MDKHCDTVRYYFSDGTMMEGTIDAVFRYGNHIGEKVNLKGYHYSHTNGKWIKIGDMNEQHIRNSIIKLTKTAMTELSDSKLSNSDFLKGMLLLSNTISELFVELDRRERFNNPRYQP